MGISSDRKEALEQFCEYGDSTRGFDTTGVLQLALVAAGDRPGCFIGVKGGDTDRIEEILEHGDFAYKFSKDGVFVADSSSHLSSTSPTRGEKRRGNFLGYPDDAVDHYVSSGAPLDEWEEFLDNETSYSPGDFESKYPFIEYVPAPNESSLEEAKKRSNQYENTLTSFPVSGVKKLAKRMK